jgi:putative hydrolase of the HAD superfamily
MTQGIVFDLDETLIDRHQAVNSFAHELWLAYFQNGSTTKKSFSEQVISMDQHGYNPRPQFFQSMLTTFPEIPSRETLESAFYGQVWETPILASGVLASLQRLREQGESIGVVTNGSMKAQLTKIRNSGLTELIDVIVVSEEFGVKKPNTSIYLEAAKKLDIEPEESWFVGDHPVNDIWGSKQVGFNTAWVHLERPWPDDLEECYDVSGIDFSDVMNKVRQARKSG